MTRDQQTDLSEFVQLWDFLEQAHTDVERMPDHGTARTALAPRQIDRTRPAGNRIYIHANTLIGSAWEHHQAFRHLIHTDGFTPRAPFTLLRPVLECSLLALWLLDPDDSETRCRRALHMEVQDWRAEKAYTTELGKLPHARGLREAAAAELNGVSKVYREEADQLGVEYRDLNKQPINLTDEIPKIDALRAFTDDDFATHVVAEWRRLSGYTHGKVWSLYLGSDSPQAVEIPGGQRMYLVPSDTSIKAAITITGKVFLSAMVLYINRCEGPAD